MALAVVEPGGGYESSVAALPIGTGTGGGMPEIGTGPSDGKERYWSLSKKKRAYTDYLFAKRPEIAEQQEARRYRHGAQWSSEQIRVLNDRRQPVVTYNRISRSVDRINGILEKYRAEPRAFPRHPRNQQSADLATAALRSALERAHWKIKSPRCIETASIDGIGGVEFILSQNQDGSYEIDLEDVDTAGFFYDPRSRKPDFSDATYLGCGKWIDADVLIDIMPDKEEQIKASIGHGDDLTSNADSDINAWFMASGDRKNVRLVYICYRYRGNWCWALFTGAYTLMEGDSYWLDRNGQGVCSYVMFSASVDHDNDRYGWVRNLKSAQDEVNQRRSKGLHEQNTRRIIGEEGAFDDIEKARREAVRPDGFVLRNKGFEAEFDDNKKNQDIQGQLAFLADANKEFEIGPGAGLQNATMVANRSGRAIALAQQAGVAELGPFVVNYQNWKQRVYEQMFYGVKKWWNNERWIRLTDDEGQQQFVQINALMPGPMGAPQVVNSLGELDVDIVIDEGPDSATEMEDLYETLSTVIPAIAPMLSPGQAQAAVQMLIDASPASSEVKKKFREAGEQAAQDPIQAQAKQAQLAKLMSETQENQSKAQLNQAKAQEVFMPKPQSQGQQKQELPMAVQLEKAFADIDKTRASAEKERSIATGDLQSARLKPIDYVQKAMDAMHNRQYDQIDLQMRKYEADSARQRSSQNASRK